MRNLQLDSRGGGRKQCLHRAMHHELWQADMLWSCVNIYTNIHIEVYFYMMACVHGACMHTYMHACIHSFAFIHTHIHTYNRQTDTINICAHTCLYNTNTCLSTSSKHNWTNQFVWTNTILKYVRPVRLGVQCVSYICCGTCNTLRNPHPLCQTGMHVRPSTEDGIGGVVASKQPLPTEDKIT